MIEITALEEYKKGKRNKVVEKASKKSEVAKAVSIILSDVKAKGDEAVRYYEHKFGNDLPLKVTDEEISKALESVDDKYISMLKRAAQNIREFHEKQIINEYEISRDGKRLGQRVIPIRRAGIYIPGGTASYPSTILMNITPAKVAGVSEIYISTPSSTPEILAAAHISGATAIYRMGGAQAIGAMAFGTQTVPKADKITGPGNIYVAEAKRQVYGITDIDSIAGPSEIVIITDNNTNPAYIAADMLAQAEHDPDATAIAITTSEALAREIQHEIDRQITDLPRKITALSSLTNNGAVIIAETLDDAVNLANEIAPEHLEICTDDPFSLLPRITNAATVFLGRYSPEALGDYYAGTNHTLPTMGTARFASPLSVYDFLKTSQYVYYDKNALMNAASDIEMFALSEGLHAHARSIAVRGEC